MSKTIKIGDFIERLNNLDFKTGTKIKFQDKIYLYDYPNLVGIYEIGKPTKREYSIFAQLDITNLHSSVEIIEEQEEIDKLEIDENGFIHTNNGSWKGRKLDVVFAGAINKLAEEVKNIKEKQ